MKTMKWCVFAGLCLVIGLYPLMYFFMDVDFGLLSTKSDDLLQDKLWQWSFNGHITLGGLALCIGWVQFKTSFRKYINFHRKVGMVYILAVLISGVCSIYLSFYATGGWISQLGFFLLGCIWLIVTWAAFLAVKNKNIHQHEKFMILSYAACFAAVTLRLWLPLLQLLFDDFITSYRIVAWICWIPNLFIALVIINTKEKKLSFQSQ